MNVIFKPDTVKIWMNSTWRDVVAVQRFYLVSDSSFTIAFFRWKWDFFIDNSKKLYGTNFKSFRSFEVQRILRIYTEDEKIVISACHTCRFRFLQHISGAFKSRKLRFLRSVVFGLQASNQLPPCSKKVCFSWSQCTSKYISCISLPHLPRPSLKHSMSTSE